jgi:hypothetical protein
LTGERVTFKAALVAGAAGRAAGYEPEYVPAGEPAPAI